MRRNSIRNGPVSKRHRHSATLGLALLGLTVPTLHAASADQTKSGSSSAAAERKTAPARPDDKQITSAVEEDLLFDISIIDEYFWSPFVDGGDITVTVDDGVATLTGNVEDTGEYYNAAENAYEGGATKVINNLKVVGY